MFKQQYARSICLTGIEIKSRKRKLTSNLELTEDNYFLAILLRMESTKINYFSFLKYKPRILQQTLKVWRDIFLIELISYSTCHSIIIIEVNSF